ncbi:hypothetical protein CYMTET_51084 [Cymbomonas tetramitiformis]|uniref:Complex III subunit 9 n=1 Tax=Cymbomonas tetramitiformis TaxID=36881 RepID=A0AAE0BMZ2_9CHLO|nr:hypothetical protein CYMTET_51084 [Cymbomonas tetramitiformis]
MYAVANSLYNVLMKRNTVTVAFVIAGALAGERFIDYTFDGIWSSKNQGKLYQHLEGTVIGGPKEEE